MTDSCDEDLFAISDEETSLPSAQSVQSNPVEDHLLKQLADVQNRIDNTVSEIDEVKATTAHILNTLERRALYGEDHSSDSDDDFYTVEGEPIVKKKKQCDNANKSVEKNLEIVSQWQCVLQDKWIIGVELQNRVQRTLSSPRYYSCIKDALEFCGESMFWQLQEDRLWVRIDSIHPNAVHVVATMVLDLPVFEEKSFADCWGTISYEIDEVEYQLPVPLVQLSVAETIDSSYARFLEENEHGAILSLKSTSGAEEVVKIGLSSDAWDGCMSQKKQFLLFMAKKAFEKIYGDVFSVKTHGSLMHCLVEVLSVDANETSIRICARSISQLNIMLHLLREEFPNVTVVEKVDVCVEAAIALIRELEMIRDRKSHFEIQKAKIMTDLLIP